MNTKRRYLINAAIGAVLSVVLGVIALSANTNTWGELSAFVSAILAGVSFILVTITLKNTNSNKEKSGSVYISTPYNLDSRLLATIKKTFKGYPVCYTDDIFELGDKTQGAISDNMRNVSYCFMIICGDLSPRQKNEIRELKRAAAKITPVIDGDNTKIPIALQEYQPISMDTFLAMGKKSS